MFKVGEEVYYQVALPGKKRYARITRIEGVGGNTRVWGHWVDKLEDVDKQEGPARALTWVVLKRLSP